MAKAAPTDASIETAARDGPDAAALPPAPHFASTHLAYLAHHTTPCLLRPFCFFVSWQGVLTLAFTGWPRPLVDLKADLAAYYGGLPPEQPGSRWPKASLGALKDGERLTPQQLQRLAAVCWECSGAFQAPGSPRSQAVLVDAVTSVIYECRSLERAISRHHMPLRGGGGGGGEAAAAGGAHRGSGGGGGGAGGGLRRAHSAGAASSGAGGSSDGGGAGGGAGGGCAAAVDASEPPQEERARVEAVVRAAEDPGYWFAASGDGNRESHYRGNALGATLVHELRCFQGGGGAGDARASLGAGGAGAGAKAYGSALPGIVRRFRERVDAALPGMYAWWADGSLHVTLRALVP